MDDILHDLHLNTEEAAKVDLKLNLVKTELITENVPSCKALLSESSELQVLNINLSEE